eukprot:g72457.t1
MRLTGPHCPFVEGGMVKLRKELANAFSKGSLCCGISSGMSKREKALDDWDSVLNPSSKPNPSLDEGSDLDAAMEWANVLGTTRADFKGADREHTPRQFGHCPDYQTSALPLYVSLGLPVKRVVRERKDPLRQYNAVKRKKVGPRELNPAGRNKLLGMTYPELVRQVRSTCCAKLKCYVWMNPIHVILARADTITQTRMQLKAWLVGQLQCMSGPNFRTKFTHRGTPVCKVMWMRVYGVHDKMLRRARVLFLANMKIDTRANVDQGDMQDLIYVILNFPSIALHVRTEWKNTCETMLVGPRCKADPPPSDVLVREVIRRDFTQVRWVRDGNYSICVVCGELATQHKKGFRDETEAAAWRERSRAHNKTHRANRVGAMNLEYTSQLCPGKVVTHLIDMTKPFYIPGCNRSSPAFRGKHVVKLHVGGATSCSTGVRFVLAHLPDIAHGTNSNITILYHILCAEVWSDKTTSAAQLNINWDGGPENTDLTAMLFFCHLIHVGWRARICTHRIVRNHSHNMQDQNFYIIRYCGWRTTLYTTNLAMGLFKLLVGLKKCADSGCENKHFKHYTRPLAWQYEPGTAVTGFVPAVKYKTWGHAEKDWRGVWDFSNPPPPDAKKVDRLLEVGVTELKKATVKELKAWLALHKVYVQGRKPTLIEGLWVHKQVCGCGLEADREEKGEEAESEEAKREAERVGLQPYRPKSRRRRRIRRVLGESGLSDSDSSVAGPAALPDAFMPFEEPNAPENEAP